MFRFFFCSVYTSNRQRKVKSSRVACDRRSSSDSITLCQSDAWTLSNISRINYKWVKHSNFPEILINYLYIDKLLYFYLFVNIYRYEGTGRSLSLKLLQQLRTQSAGSNSHNGKNEKEQNEKTLIGRQLHELTLDESIRYKPGDSVEQWLCDLLCLNVTTHAPILSGCPPPDTCQLYYINRYFLR